MMIKDEEEKWMYSVHTIYGESILSPYEMDFNNENVMDTS